MEALMGQQECSRFPNCEKLKLIRTLDAAKYDIQSLLRDICWLCDKKLGGDSRECKDDLGKTLKQARFMVPLTLRELATKSGISMSYVCRIERGERFPSARILQKIARPLGFDENEIFTLAGYLSPPPSPTAKEDTGYDGERLDPYVTEVLAQEPVKVQRAVIGILTILKGIAKAETKVET